VNEAYLTSTRHPNQPTNEAPSKQADTMQMKLLGTLAATLLAFSSQVNAQKFPDHAKHGGPHSRRRASSRQNVDEADVPEV